MITFPVQGKPHDPDICGLDPATDCEYCRPKTLAYQQNQLRAERIGRIIDKLQEEFGIDAEDLADTMMMLLDQRINEIVETRARQLLDNWLREVTLVSHVQRARMK